MQEIYDQIFWMVSVTFIFTALVVPYIIKVAHHIGALDIPNNRKVHLKTMPRLGGLAIFLGYLLGFMLFVPENPQMLSILIGSFIIILTGVIDDIKPLKASTKFIGQLTAALIVVFYGHIVMTELSAFGFYINFGIFSELITIFFILGAINCINFIDGLDGLSGGISSIYFCTIGIVTIIQSKFTTLEFYLTFIMLGSTLGFLVHNFHPAKIFAGDSGSMFLGFIIAVIALLGYKNVTLTSLIIPLLLLGIPILDTVFAIIRRKIKGEPISAPDKSHLHHQILGMHFSHRNTVLIIYAIDILFAIASIIYVLKKRELSIIIYTILVIIILIFVFKTNIIVDREKYERKMQGIKKKDD